MLMFLNLSGKNFNFIQIFQYQSFCCVATELNQNGHWNLITDSSPTESEDFTYFFLCHSHIQPKQKLHTETFVCNIPFSNCVCTTFWDSVKTKLLRWDSLHCSSRTASVESFIAFCTDSTSEDTSPSYALMCLPATFAKQSSEPSSSPTENLLSTTYKISSFLLVSFA